MSLLRLAILSCCASLLAAAEPLLSSSLVQQLLAQGKTCCAALQLALPDKVSFPNTPAYNASLTSYWSLQEVEVHPSCVVSPESTKDVATAVAVLSVGGQLLSKGSCEFAVRSGGHTTFAGSANVQGGVTIDLSALAQVTPSKDLSTVVVGPGNRWADVYLKLDALGIAIGGGRVAEVGVGGLTLGGGISFFSPRYGFVCDNVVRFEVVLPSGVVVNATQTSNADLWKALKGGSNNFGIVTAFEATAFKQGKLWGGAIVSNISNAPASFAAFESFTGNPSYDPYGTVISSYAYQTSAKQWFISNYIVYTKPEPNPPAFTNFTGIPQLQNSTRISNLTDFTEELNLSNPSGRRQLFATATYANSAKMMARFFDIAKANVAGLDEVPNLSFSFTFQPVPTIITSVAKSRGGNSLGLDPEDGNLMNVLAVASWDTAADDALVEEQVKEVLARAKDEAVKMGLFNQYEYLNYAADWQDPIGGYGEEVKKGLQAVSTKYDPTGVFQRQVPGGFKLFK